jgi:hypothetical protein
LPLRVDATEQASVILTLHLEGKEEVMMVTIAVARMRGKMGAEKMEDVPRQKWERVRAVTTIRVKKTKQFEGRKAAIRVKSRIKL